MRLYTLRFALLLSLSTLAPSCDESGDAIVIDVPIGSGDENDDSSNPGDIANCQFDGLASSFNSCLSLLSNEELNVATWNIKFFPIEENITIGKVASIVENLDADVIAVQEIISIDDFKTLGNSLVGWEALAVDVSGSLDLGYLFKTCELEQYETPTAILTGAVEPRPAVKTKIKHANGTEVTLLNIHLKALSGESNELRRKNAAIAIKKYIDENLSTEKVMVLGDWNDDLDNGSPFQTFLDDPENYKFADSQIAIGSSSNWSYPSFPSHIDHIMISNELFDQLTSTSTIKLEGCVPNYSGEISDHRMVMSTFKK